MYKRQLLIIGSILAFTSVVLARALSSPASETDEDVGFANFAAPWNALSFGLAL